MKQHKKDSERRHKKGVKLHAGMPRYSNRLSYAELLELESDYGRRLFGPIPEGHERKFFTPEKNVWIWYEGWQDATGAAREMTVRYEVRPSGIFRRAEGSAYQKLNDDELDNFRVAARNYLQIVKENLYN